MTYLIHGNELIHLPGFEAEYSGGGSIHIFDADDERESRSPFRFNTFSSPIPSWMIPNEKIRTIDHDLMQVDWAVQKVEQVRGHWRMSGKALRWRRPASIDRANNEVAAAIERARAA